MSAGTELKARALERLRSALANAPEVRWAYLFGSAARGQPYGDLDVGVMLEPGASGVQALGRLVLALEAAAEGVRVDVVDLRSAAPGLVGSVLREGQVLLERQAEERLRWEIEARRRALDMEPWQREFERLRLATLRAGAG